VSLEGAAGAERRRIEDVRERHVPWWRWGPYLAERQWGTVREDYSPDGSAWDSFPHDHARSRAYRWGEDGLLGISDNHGRLCFALALWNGQDPILKERLFGLTGSEGNHGEDVKEAYFYLDATPSHSYLRALYKYPQRAFPYAELVAENRRRTRSDAEYELVETGIFDQSRYFDVFVEYAKDDPSDVIIRLTVFNRGPEQASVHLLPTLWFRNTWSWGLDSRNEAVVHARTDTINPEQVGTKMAAWYTLELGPGEARAVMLRLSQPEQTDPFEDAETILRRRQAEADAFYTCQFGADCLDEDAQRVQRQAFAGLIWSKQFYAYEIDRWLSGDPAGPVPPAQRRRGRNAEWKHLHNRDVISMPDTWEYPWYAAWDLAFHCIPLAMIDPEFAKRQLRLLLREWYMHPNGQLPAYEWSFSDVNPPVHAWAVWRVYKIDRRMTGRADVVFLERMFHKLLLNFTWWVNRKDAEGRNVFQGGFLGLDNIGVFDRSAPLPLGGQLDQSDGTAWMGMFCLNMLAIALELARVDQAYEDVASKFFEHFLYIAEALNNLGRMGIPFWNEEDEFFYDVLQYPSGEVTPLKVRSLVGLIPLLAVETIEPDVLEHLPAFARRMQWFLDHRPDLASLVSHWEVPGVGRRRLLALARGHRMKRLLSRMLDPDEFLSDYGVRATSRYHLDHPYRLELDGQVQEVRYEPAESSTPLFGGNSNWRGPIWFPINFLLVEALQRFHHYYGDDFLVECPTRSGAKLTLWQIASEISMRLTRIFLRDENGRRPVFGANELYQTDPQWRDYIPFYEYFHGDTGRGIGASHQTGWTALVAKLLEQTSTQRMAPRKAVA
jgi:hypothetical protein